MVDEWTTSGTAKGERLARPRTQGGRPSAMTAEKATAVLDRNGVGMNVEEIDSLMMGHCIGLSKASGKAGEYPYAAVICRDGMIVAESVNTGAHEGGGTRQAEVPAISQAQKPLGIVSLEDCEIYRNVEPCALCSYAIRET